MDGDSSTGTPIFDLDILGVVMLEIQLELLMEAKEEELPFWLISWLDKEFIQGVGKILSGRLVFLTWEVVELFGIGLPCGILKKEGGNEVDTGGNMRGNEVVRERLVGGNEVCWVGATDDIVGWGERGGGGNEFPLR